MPTSRITDPRRKKRAPDPYVGSREDQPDDDHGPVAERGRREERPELRSVLDENESRNGEDPDRGRCRRSEGLELAIALQEGGHGVRGQSENSERR